MAMYIEQFGDSVAAALKRPDGQVAPMHYKDLIKGFMGSLGNLVPEQIRYAKVGQLTADTVTLTISANLGYRYVYLEGSHMGLSCVEDTGWLFKTVGESLKLTRVPEDAYNECHKCLVLSQTPEQAYNAMESAYTYALSKQAIGRADIKQYLPIRLNEMQNIIQIPSHGTMHEPWSHVLENCLLEKEDTITPVTMFSYKGVCMKQRLYGIVKEQLEISYQGLITLPQTHDLLMLIATS